MELIQVKVSRGQLPDWTGAPLYGYGYGYGYGDGYGYGNGDGNGDGYGYGNGDGYGDGNGDGNGYGNGYGYGLQYIPIYQQQREGWPEAVQARINQVERECSVLAFWRSDAMGLPSNSGKRSIAPAAPGVVHEVGGTLQICSHGLHATMNPEKWEGERLWVVALYGEVVWQDDKCAGLKREIIYEVKL